MVHPTLMPRTWKKRIERKARLAEVEMDEFQNYKKAFGTLKISEVSFTMKSSACE